MTTFCATCGENTPSVRVEMRGAGNSVKVCAKGHAIEQAPALRQVAGPSGEGFVDEDGEPVQFTFGGPFTPAPAQAPQSKRAKSNAKPPQSLGARDTLKEIKTRRRAILAEIKRLEALRVEDNELAAAEIAIEAARRAAKVRPIRSEVAS